MATQTGELERLKEFGITKKMLEEQAALMGKTPFDKKGSLQDQEALNAALFAIMEKRYKGGMATQATSFNGMLSNASDFMAGIGRELGKPIFDKAKVMLQDFLNTLDRLTENGAIDRFMASLFVFGNRVGTVFSTSAAIISKFIQIVGPLLGAVFGSLWNVAGPVFDLFTSNLPAIAKGFKAAGNAAQVVSDVIVNNWNLIGPIIEGVAVAWAIYGVKMLSVKAWTLATAAATGIQAAALVAYRTVMLATTIAMMALRGQFVLLWFTMLANPIGLVVTALGLLIGIGLLVYKNWDLIKAGFMAAFGFMAKYVSIAGAAISSFFSGVVNWSVNAWNIAKAAVIGWGVATVNAVSGVFDWIGAKFAAASAWKDNLLNSLGPIGDVLKNQFTTIGNTIATLSPLIVRLGLSFLGVSGPIGWVIAGVASLSAFLFKLVNNNEGVRNSLVGAWESVKAGMQPVMDMFAQMGQVFMGMLAPAIAEFEAAFATLGPEFQKTGQIMATSFAELGPAFAELGAAFGELVAAVMGLLPMLIPPILEIATTVLPALLNAYMSIFPAILSIVQAVIPIVTQLLTTLIPVIAQIAIAVLPMLAQAVTAIFPLILAIIQAVLPIVIQLISTLIPVITQIAMSLIPLILQVVQAVFPVVLAIIQAVIPVVIQIIMAIVPIIMMIVTAVIPLILQVVQAVFPVILAIISAVIPVITGLLTLVAKIITGVLVPAIQIILKVVQVVFTAITTVIQVALAIITGIIKAATALIQGDWAGAWAAIKETAVTIMNAIINFFKGIDLVQVGKDIIKGLINGIGSMAGAAVAKVKEVAGNVKDAVTGFFNINSPSKVFHWIGDMLGLGLIGGMADSQAGITRAAEGMAEAAMISPNAVQELQGVLRVATIFDGATAPNYAGTNSVPVTGRFSSGSKQGSGNYINKLVEKIELIAGPETDGEALVDQFLEKLHDRLQGADEILGANMGALL